MKTKICSKCKQEKLIEEFYKDKTTKDELQSVCKFCTTEHNIKYRKSHKEETKEYCRIHKKERNEYTKKWYIEHKKEKQTYVKEWRKTHQKQIKEQNRNYEKNHKVERREQEVNRRRTDINFRILGILRRRLWNALKGNCKSARTVQLLGCSIEFLKDYLTKKFTTGMSFDNYGKWHIDHVNPCASFDLSKPCEQQKCFHYTNLQPLWANENQSKGSKIIYLAHTPLQLLVLDKIGRIKYYVK